MTKQTRKNPNADGGSPRPLSGRALDKHIEQARAQLATAKDDTQRLDVIRRAVNGGGPVYRDCSIVKRQHGDDDGDGEAGIVGEDRQFEFSFSSEARVERWWGIEILDHKPESVRMERFNNGAPLLTDHWARQENHVGKIVNGSATIDKGVGRAVGLLGRNPKSEAVRNDINDEILTHVSVGYLIHELVLEEQRDNEPPVYRVTDWEPLEASLLPLAADDHIGVGRGYQLHRSQEPTNMKDKQNRSEQDVNDIMPETPAPVVDVSAERAQVRKDELARINDLQAIKRMYAKNQAVRELADKAMSEGMSLDEFRAQAMPLFAKPAGRTEQVPASDIGLSDKEIRGFSIMKAVRAIAAAKAGHGTLEKFAPFEAECSRAISERLNKEPTGLFIPLDVQRSGSWGGRVGMQKRAVPMDTTEDSHLVATEHLAGSFIDVLMERSTVLRLGAIVLDGLVGNVDIPGFTNDLTWAWLAEDADATDSEPGTRTVALTPHTVAGAVPISRRLLKQSTPAVEMLIRNLMVRGAANAIDSGTLQGDGVGANPLGVINTTGINTSTITTAAAPAHDELVAFETALLVDVALFGNLAYVFQSAFNDHLKTTVLDAGSGRFLMNDNMVNGYPGYFTTNLPANGIVFGNWESVIIGMWGVLDISADWATKAASGGLVLRAFQDVDVGVQHAVGFCKNA